MYTSPFPSQCSRSALMSQPPSTKSKSYSLRFRNLSRPLLLFSVIAKRQVPYNKGILRPLILTRTRAISSTLALERVRICCRFMSK